MVNIIFQIYFFFAVTLSLPFPCAIPPGVSNDLHQHPW